MSGENPIRFQCGPGPCYRRKYGLRVEEFAKNLPGKISLSDIDGNLMYYAERYGRVLILEAKGRDVELDVAQQIAFPNMSHTGQITIIVISGDCETHEFYRYKRFSNGAIDPPWVFADTEAIGLHIAEWASWASNHPVHGIPLPPR